MTTRYGIFDAYTEPVKVHPQNCNKRERSLLRLRSLSSCWGKMLFRALSHKVEKLKFENL